MSSIQQSRILILDFGSQYTQLIARRVREMGVYCEIYPFDKNEDKIRSFRPSGIILSGGPESVNVAIHFRAPACVFELSCPVLGICYGMQTMAAQLGGKVEAGQLREFGHAAITRLPTVTQLLEGLPETSSVWMSHGDKVTQLPTGFEVIASSPNTAITAMANEAKRWYGVQFHPEVTHSECGKKILDNFVLHICGCKALWTSSNIINESIAAIDKQVGKDEVILGLSGGVDSSVLAALLHRAIGSQLTCVFVDTGLLRLHEGDQVMAMFAEHMGIRVIRVDAETQFLNALKGVEDPEAKRKTIGKLFIDIFEREARQINAKWLAQGTIYADVIESAGGSDKAHLIKSHHNVGGLPERMNLKLLEPLRELFKDEVRKMGVELGLPPSMIYRHPFPGPGLGVRILGEVSKDKADLLRAADAIFIEELIRADWYDKVSQAFAVFLPVKSVGVMGDGRRYDYVVSLRAVQTVDFMTAHWARLPYELLDLVAHRIVNEVPGIARVTYDITGKPPATIEWE